MEIYYRNSRVPASPATFLFHLLPFFSPFYIFQETFVSEISEIEFIFFRIRFANFRLSPLRNWKNLKRLISANFFFFKILIDDG